jgi:hypothetical protein
MLWFVPIIVPCSASLVCLEIKELAGVERKEFPNAVSAKAISSKGINRPLLGLDIFQLYFASTKDNKPGYFHYNNVWS